LLQLAQFDQHDEGVEMLNERNLNDFGKYPLSGNDTVLTDTVVDKLEERWESQ